MNKRTLIRDAILILSVIIVALLFFFIIEGVKKDGAFAVVEYKGEEIARYPLGQDGVYTLQPEKDYTADGEPIFLGGINVIRIEGGKVSMESADCPDKLCVYHYKISRTGESITCLPNRISVIIEGNSTEEEIFESY